MRKADIVVALGLMMVGLLVLGDSVRIGFRMGNERSRGRFFPFLYGVGDRHQHLLHPAEGHQDSQERGTRKTPYPGGRHCSPILWVLLPAIGVILLTELLGLHLATILYLAFYMGVVGKIQWGKVILLSVLVPLVVYVLFDRIFLIPLPEGVWGKDIMALIPF